MGKLGKMLNGFDKKAKQAEKEEQAELAEILKKEEVFMADYAKVRRELVQPWIDALAKDFNEDGYKTEPLMMKDMQKWFRVTESSDGFILHLDDKLLICVTPDKEKQVIRCHLMTMKGRKHQSEQPLNEIEEDGFSQFIEDFLTNTYGR